MGNKIVKSEEEWKKELTSEKFRILRKRRTEPAGTGKLLYNKNKGTYLCSGCEQELFSSENKFDSGSGWPSFTQAISPENVEFKEDKSFLKKRTEVLCSRCGGHLGHIFDDGPKPEGKRFCINSLSLDFKKNPQIS